MTIHLLYLEGFCSSPQSFKAQRLRGGLQAHQPALLLEHLGLQR